MCISVEAEEGGVKREEDVPACQLTIEDNRGPQRRIQTVGKEGAGAGAGGGGGGVHCAHACIALPCGSVVNRSIPTKDVHVV